MKTHAISDAWHYIISVVQMRLYVSLFLYFYIISEAFLVDHLYYILRPTDLRIKHHDNFNPK